MGAKAMRRAELKLTCTGCRQSAGNDKKLQLLENKKPRARPE
jgi:hypothetical protein